MKIVILSDTHNYLARAVGTGSGFLVGEDQVLVPDGDVLVHCGDATCNGTAVEYEQFNAALAMLPHEHKIVIAGNHDLVCEDDPELAVSLLTEATYLQDSGVIIEGIKFWGTPWQPGIASNFAAFTLPPASPELSKHWAQIPPDTDVLITHTPPEGILDKTGGKFAGCHVLRRYLAYQLNPKVHCFGHVHSSRGEFVDPDTGIHYVNAAITDSHDKLGYAPIVVEL